MTTNLVSPPGLDKLLDKTFRFLENLGWLKLKDTLELKENGYFAFLFRGIAIAVIVLPQTKHSSVDGRRLTALKFYLC